MQALERLLALRDQGILSEQEFLETKRRIIDDGHTSSTSANREINGVSMNSLSKFSGIPPIVIFDHPKAPVIPAEIEWVIRYSGGWIKGQGVSLSGIEYMTLIVGPSDLVVFGRYSREVWRKPIRGMRVEKDKLASVRFIAEDGESVVWVLEIQYRKRLIDAFDYIQHILNS